MNPWATATYGSGVSSTTTSSTAGARRSARPAGPTGTATTTRLAPALRHQLADAMQVHPVATPSSTRTAVRVARAGGGRSPR
jgi:hypothetical protein